MTGLTFVAQSHNLWGDHHAAEREVAMRAFYTRRAPDLLATQETRAWSRDLLDEVLTDHDRVDDAFAGWESQSNLWWDRSLFSYIEHGAEDVGIHDAHARLFWVRLRTAEGNTMVWATAHLSYSGNPVEVETGVNQRTLQARRIVAELERIAGDDEVVFLASDTNAIGAAIWEIGNAGYLEPFTALNRQSPPTHPVIPNAFQETVGTGKSPIASSAKAIDFIFFRGPVRARSAEVAEFFDRGVAPSDHYPVVSTFTLTAA